MWIVCCNEGHLGLLEGGNEMQVPRQSVQLGNEQRVSMFFAQADGFKQHWSVGGVFAGLNLGQFSNNLTS